MGNFRNTITNANKNNIIDITNVDICHFECNIEYVILAYFLFISLVSVYLFSNNGLSSNFELLIVYSPICENYTIKI